VLGGIVVIYAIGVPVTAFTLHLPIWGALVDASKFLPGDAIKAVVTVLVASQVHRAYPGLIPRRRAVDAETTTPAATPAQASDE
jgi:biotin transport system substrate-specific component